MPDPICPRMSDKPALRGHALALCLLWTVVCLPCRRIQAQTGEPGVYDSSGHPVNSPLFLDAKQYQASGDDMCAAIFKACGSSSAIPGGTTIDARGFTGNQVCKATSVTTMLSKCTSNGGKLLLGTVNLYADGPSSPSYYADSYGSAIGTPAFLIPSGFWGIEGISRGTSPGGTGSNPPPGPGTFLSVCTGNNALR